MLAALLTAGLAVAGLRGAADEGDPAATDIKPLALADQDAAGTQAEAAGAARASSSSSGSSRSSSTSGSSGSSTTSSHEAFSLAWVPRDATVVAALRPAELLGRPALAGIKRTLSDDEELQRGLGVPFERIEQATIVFLVDPDNRPGPPAAFVLRLRQAADAAAVIGAVQPDPQEEEYGGQKYLRPKQGQGHFCFRADERTVLRTRS